MSSILDKDVQDKLARQYKRLRAAEGDEARPKKRPRPPRPTLVVADDNSAEQRARNEKLVKEAAAGVNITEVNRQANAKNKEILRYHRAVAALKRIVKRGRDAVRRKRQGSSVIQHGPPRAEDSEFSGAETEVMPSEPDSDLRKDDNLFMPQLPALPALSEDDDDDDTSPPTDVTSTLRF